MQISRLLRLDLLTASKFTSTIQQKPGCKPGFFFSKKADRGNCLLILPPTFHGSPGEDPEDWLDQFERVAVFNRWEDDTKLRYVFFSLDGPAKTWRS